MAPSHMPVKDWHIWETVPCPNAALGTTYGYLPCIQLSEGKMSFVMECYDMSS